MLIYSDVYVHFKSIEFVVTVVFPKVQENGCKILEVISINEFPGIPKKLPVPDTDPEYTATPLDFKINQLLTSLLLPPVLKGDNIGLIEALGYKLTVFDAVTW